MADADNSPQPVLPPFILDYVQSLSRLGLTALAGWLVHRGFISEDQTSQFLNLGLALAVAGATVGWSFIKARFNAKKLVAAAATGLPSANPKAPEVQEAVVAAIADPRSAIAAKEIK